MWEKGIVQLGLVSFQGDGEVPVQGLLADPGVKGEVSRAWIVL